jgi:hypothetical protein
MQNEPTLAGAIFLVALIALHFAPTYIALYRKHVQANAIATLNVLGGWTIVGWVVAMVWALTANTRDG